MSIGRASWTPLDECPGMNLDRTLDRTPMSLHGSVQSSSPAVPNGSQRKEREDAAILTSQPTRKWLNSAQAADYAQVSTKTLYRAVNAGRLKAARIGRDLRFIADWLDAWLLSTVDR
jgi:excisionase family DNA binding protein